MQQEDKKEMKCTTAGEQKVVRRHWQRLTGRFSNEIEAGLTVEKPRHSITAIVFPLRLK